MAKSRPAQLASIVLMQQRILMTLLFTPWNSALSITCGTEEAAIHKLKCQPPKVSQAQVSQISHALLVEEKDGVDASPRSVLHHEAMLPHKLAEGEESPQDRTLQDKDMNVQDILLAEKDESAREGDKHWWQRLLLGGIIHFAGPEAVDKQLGWQDPAIDKHFLSFLASHGVKELYPPLAKLAIGPQPDLGGERGLLIAKPVEEGEVLITIPFNASFALADSDEELYEGAEPELSLAAKLLREIAKGIESPHWPHLATLPLWLPLPWCALQPEDFALAQLPATQLLMQRHLEFFSEVYMSIESPRHIIANATWREFCWAVSVIHTHAYFLDVPVSRDSSETEAVAMLLPVADLLNHASEETVDWFSQGLHHDRLELVARRHLALHQPATAYYGDYSSEYFLMAYGFLPDGNKDDTTKIFDSLGELCTWFLQKYHPTLSGCAASKPHGTSPTAENCQLSQPESKKFMEAAEAGVDLFTTDRGEVNTEGPDYFVFPDGHPGLRLIGALAGLHLALHGDLQLASSDEAQTAAHLAAQTDVRHRCKELLESFPTSVEEDKLILEEGSRKEVSGACKMEVQACQGIVAGDEEVGKGCREGQGVAGSNRESIDEGSKEGAGVSYPENLTTNRAKRLLVKYRILKKQALAAALQMK